MLKVVRRWREGRQEDIWRMGIEAREFWKWLKADKQMRQDGHGVGGTAGEREGVGHVSEGDD